MRHVTGRPAPGKLDFVAAGGISSRTEFPQQSRVRGDKTCAIRCIGLVTV